MINIMMKQILLFSFLIIGYQAFAQKYVTKNGKIRFYSEAPAENIEAINNQVNCALDAESGNLVFKVLIKSFVFEKALMQEHFNENYMESDKFPNATFSGNLVDKASINYTKNGAYTCKIKGVMTIHGVSKDIEEEGTFTVEGNSISGHSVFMIKLADYDIKIPGTVVDNISETIEVTVDVKLDQLAK